jgi:uncharacterized protein
MNNEIVCKSLIVKVASRCNLNCAYCYMYNLGDESFRNQPKFMSYSTVDKIIEEVKSHCEQHGLKSFEFIFHGGEPLLQSRNFYEYFVDEVKKQLPKKIKPFFAIQTNGVLLTEEWCKLLNKLKIEIGISIDGYQESHDQYRKTHTEEGSFEAVIKGYKMALQASDIAKSPGILCVINIHANTEKIYLFLKEYQINFIDFLLPDCSYEKMPLGYEDGIKNRTLYADWLIAMFDHWFSDNGNRPQILFFEQLVKIIIGIDEGFEYIGNLKAEFLTIETNGSIEVSGAFKVCGNGFTKKGYNIKTHSLDEALKDDLAQRYVAGHENLCTECHTCPIVEVCGGGFIAHRYSKTNGFNNPSVYCLDLKKLIVHIQNRVLDFLPNEFVERNQLDYLVLEDLINS